MGETTFGDYPEWQSLLMAVVYGIGCSLFGVVAVSLWRWVRHEPLWPKREKITSPSGFYFGVVLFAGFGALTLYQGRPLFAAFFFVVVGAYGVGFVRFQRGWRG